MRVRVCSGRKVAYHDITHDSGDIIDVPDDVADRWIAAGDAKATLRAKPIAAPRPLYPDTSR